MASPSFARSVCGIDVHSLPRDKERTKKTRQRLPPLETASVPHYMDKNEI
jgi:hypothetical protein